MLRTSCKSSSLCLSKIFFVSKIVMCRTSVRRAFCYLPTIAMLTLMAAFNGTLVRFGGVLCQRNEDDEVEQKLIGVPECEEKLGALTFEIMTSFYPRYANRSDWNRFITLEDGTKLQQLVCNVIAFFTALTDCYILQAARIALHVTEDGTQDWEAERLGTQYAQAYNGSLNIFFFFCFFTR